MSELDNEQIPAELPTVKPEAPEERAPLSLEEQMRLLEDAERAIGEAYTTGKAERSKITEAAQQSAQVAVELAGEAIEADPALKRGISALYDAVARGIAGDELQKGVVKLRDMVNSTEQEIQAQQVVELFANS